jgi:hypothetical protein
MPEKQPLPDISIAHTWVQVLAAAYELEPEEVVRDAVLAANWRGSEPELRALLRERHAWHPSIPRYYLSALRAELGTRRT